MSNDIAKIEYINPNIGFHSFSTNVAERLVRFEVLKFKDSLYLWIGDARSRSFRDLALAIQLSRMKEPASTKIMGEPTNLVSYTISNKLSKKLNKPVYVSYNLPDDRLTVPAVNRKISEELSKHLDYF